MCAYNKDSMDTCRLRATSDAMPIIMVSVADLVIALYFSMYYVTCLDEKEEQRFDKEVREIHAHQEKHL